MSMVAEDFQTGQPQAPDLDALAKALNIERYQQLDSKRWSVLVGFDPRERKPKFKTVFPTVFNDDGTPYFNDDSDMRERAQAAMEAATIRSQQALNRLKENAVARLKGMGVTETAEFLQGLPADEQRVYLEAEASEAGKQREDILNAFNFKE